MNSNNVYHYDNNNWSYEVFRKHVSIHSVNYWTWFHSECKNVYIERRSRKKNNILKFDKVQYIYLNDLNFSREFGNIMILKFYVFRYKLIILITENFNS